MINKTFIILYTRKNFISRTVGSKFVHADQEIKLEITSVKSKTRIEISTHKKYISLVLIKGEYSSNKYLEKIGVDGV
ncbi:hypothetical protein [Spiroplasma endosymbiont of Cantharis nigra]|uniref:hypothetical protein n=1 Tax=Spiroplasma endosymbiont of Cantharis nigra TaxID=3066278 RepID=UPI0030D4A6F8